MIRRICNPILTHSFFLFGPRGTGKSTLLTQILPQNQSHTFDLLDYDLENQLLERPAHFREILEGLPNQIRWIIIDEVQKLPFLLDAVHQQIEKNKGRFLFALTGSSARKLKRGQANLLAGRAFAYHLHPLTMEELKHDFSLQDVLRYGSLPELFSLKSEEEKEKFLRTYVKTYLQEEIQMEGLVRQLKSFRRFLPLAARESGQVLAWTNFASDVGVDAKTIQSYFQILEDTLIGFLLPAYQRSVRKRQRTHPKFYLFDLGIKRALASELKLPLLPGTDAFGRAFEHFILLEIKRLNDYLETDFEFSYFATHDLEIDLVIERPGKETIFLEIKSSENVRTSELTALSEIVADAKNARGICVCRGSRRSQWKNILICPWQEIFEEIGLKK